MRASITLAIALSAAMHSIVVPAQSGQNTDVRSVPASPVAPASALDRLPPKLFYPGDVFYPEALAKQGVQGEVKLEIAVSKATKTPSVKIIAGSLSADLDKSAQDYVQGDSWKLPVPAGVEIPEATEKKYVQSIIFLRDSVLTINTKTCADFNADLAYFKTIRPDADVGEVGALEMIASLFTVQLIKNADAAETLKFVRTVAEIDRETVKACSEKPEALLLETYVGNARKHQIKF